MLAAATSRAASAGWAPLGRPKAPPDEEEEEVDEDRAASPPVWPRLSWRSRSLRLRSSFSASW